MYNSEKIGVGILTCNRRQTTENILYKLSETDYVDECIIVKNKEYDYGDFETHIPQRFRYVNIKEDVGVGFCKNEAFKYLLDTGCQHIFLIEDDTIIKNTDVFKIYIDTAKFFKFGHLVFGYGSSGQNLNQFDEEKSKPYHMISYQNIKLDFYFHLQGGFCYFSRDALQKVGLMDDVHYINALEHVEHTFRLCMHNFYTPFWAFADVHNSRDYLDWFHKDEEYSTTIDQNEVYKTRLANAYAWFRKLYNINVNQIPIHPKQEINRFIMERMSSENS